MDVAFVVVDATEQFLTQSRDDTLHFVVVRLPHHGETLAPTRLTIRNNAHIVPKNRQ